MTQYLVVVICLFVLVGADVSDSAEKRELVASCSRFCNGPQYECVDGQCYCAQGYVPNYYFNRCRRCPEIGEKCYGTTTCCSEIDEPTLTCWQGVCKVCTDSDNNWICRDLDSIYAISSTQVAMATALILGIIATFVLLYKLCGVASLRPYGRSPTNYDNSRPSVGSLQLYVDERLRDAPPRYSTAPPTSNGIPATIYLNAGFIHDSSIPPPPYTPKEENPRENQFQSNNTVHM